MTSEHPVGLPPPPPPWTGYLPAPPTAISQARPRKQGHLRLLVVLTGCVGALAGVLSLVAAKTAPSSVPTCHGPTCRPSLGKPVGPPFTYRSAAYGFVVGYSIPTNSGGEPIAVPTASPTRLELDYPGLDNAPASITFTAERDAGSSPQQVVEAVQSRQFSGARLAYPLWNAMVGYQPGYGAVYDYQPESANGTAVRERVVVVAAVKRGLVVVVVAAGTYHRFTPSFSGGQPSALDVAVGLLLDDRLNSVRWPGDPPR